MKVKSVYWSEIDSEDDTKYSEQDPVQTLVTLK